MKDSWDKVSQVTPMRAASPPRQIERENEMIVISHRQKGATDSQDSMEKAEEQLGMKSSIQEYLHLKWQKATAFIPHASRAFIHSPTRYARLRRSL